jgi:hypothetical protein
VTKILDVFGFEDTAQSLAKAFPFAVFAALSLDLGNEDNEFVCDFLAGKSYRRYSGIVGWAHESGLDFRA